MSSTIMWFCFINTVYTFFLIYPERMEVKWENMVYNMTILKIKMLIYKTN